MWDKGFTYIPSNSDGTMRRPVVYQDAPEDVAYVTCGTCGIKVDVYGKSWAAAHEALWNHLKKAHNAHE